MYKILEIFRKVWSFRTGLATITSPCLVQVRTDFNETKSDSSRQNALSGGLSEKLPQKSRTAKTASPNAFRLLRTASSASHLLRSHSSLKSSTTVSSCSKCFLGGSSFESSSILSHKFRAARERGIENGGAEEDG